MGRWAGVLRWTQEHRLAVDASGAALFALVTVPTTAVWLGPPSAAAPLALLVVAPLAWRRVRPAASAAAVYAAALLHMVLGHPILVPADLAVLVALYSVTVHGPRWAHRTAIIGAFAGAVLLGVLAWWSARDVATAAGMAAFTAAVALAVWSLGLVRRSRREAMAALVDRARRLEVERDQQAQIATAAERARIAREMHDIVAHSLTVMVAQADGGRYAARADPAAAERVLGTIAEAGRAALADMRRLLGVLREDGSGAAPGGAAHTGASPGVLPERAVAAAPVVPQPAEGDIEALVEQVRASGLRVSLVRVGAPRTLPPGSGLALYRICQEALTNVLKHAGPDPAATVVLQFRASGVALEVSDDGRGAAADSDGLGQGLLGMRERAAMFGGSVTVGPRPGGGFRVRAELPLPPASRSVTSAPTGVSGGGVDGRQVTP